MNSWLLPVARRPFPRLHYQQQHQQQDARNAVACDDLILSFNDNDFLNIMDMVAKDPYLRHSWDLVANMWQDELNSAYEKAPASLKPAAARKKKVWNTLCRSIEESDRARISILQKVWVQLYVSL